MKNSFIIVAVLAVILIASAAAFLPVGAWEGSGAAVAAPVSTALPGELEFIVLRSGRVYFLDRGTGAVWVSQIGGYSKGRPPVLIVDAWR